MTECLFSVLAKEPSNGWALKHRPGVRHAFHNHEPSLHPSAHPIHRQLSRIPELKAFSNAGLAPKEIQTVVRESGSLATRQDIYNRIAEVRRDSREGQSPIHALAKQLEGEGFWSRVEYDQGIYITAVLFAHPDSLALIVGITRATTSCFDQRLVRSVMKASFSRSQKRTLHRTISHWFRPSIDCGGRYSRTARGGRGRRRSSIL